MTTVYTTFILELLSTPAVVVFDVYILLRIVVVSVVSSIIVSNYTVLTLVGY